MFEPQASTLAGSLGFGAGAASADDSLGDGEAVSDGEAEPEAEGWFEPLGDPLGEAEAEAEADPLAEADEIGRALKLAKLSVADEDELEAPPPPRLAATLPMAKTTVHTTRMMTKRARITAMIRRRRYTSGASRW